MNGVVETRRMLAAGFTQEEVGAWQNEQSAKMRSAGFSEKEINDHFGRYEPDLKGLQEYMKGNLIAFGQKPATIKSDQVTAASQPKSTFEDAIAAGLQISTSGLAFRGKAPDTKLPENAPMAHRIASKAATLVGDVPAMAAGFALGGGLASPMTAFAGSFALPEGLRATLMDAYEKGDFANFGEFWERGGGVIYDTAKAWTTGALTYGAGQLAGRYVGNTTSVFGPVQPRIMSPMGRTGATVSAELGTMATVGAALEGHAPKAEDFIDAAILLGGAKATMGTARVARDLPGKLRDIYRDFGMKPEEVVDAAGKYPSVAQDLASTDRGIPRVLVSEGEPRMVINPESLAMLDPGFIEKMITRSERNGTAVDVETPQVSALVNLRGLMTKYNEGRISEGQLGFEVKQLLDRLEEKREVQLQRQEGRDRVRGPEWVEERLLRALRTGELTSEQVNMARFLLRENPALAEGLGISVKSSKNPFNMEAGNYNPAAKIMTLFTDSTKPDVAVHEILHHSERMMPPEVQVGIREEWSNRVWDALKAAEKSGDKERVSTIGLILKASLGDEAAAKLVAEAFKNGKLKYEDYQLSNPSEFWAVNATRIMADRYAAQGSWVKMAQQWMREFYQHAKAFFGLNSDAAVLKGLREVLGSDGEFQSKKMLAGRDKGVYNAPRTPEEEAILGRLSVGEKDTRSYSWERFYSAVKDDLFALRNMPETYQLARLTRGAFGRAEQFLDNAAFKFDTYANVGKSLKALLDPVKMDLDGIRAFAVAARNIELDGRGIKTGIPLAESQAVVAAGQQKYGQVFKELGEYQQHLVEYLRDAGLISKETFKLMMDANKDYVPFFRMLDDGPGGAGGAGGGMTTRNPIHGIRGSDRIIIDPLESIIKNTYLYTMLAERNAVAQALVREAPSAGIKIDRVKTPVRPIELTEKEVKDIVAQYGVTPQQAQAFSIFRAKTVMPDANEIVVYENGKRMVYRVPEEIAAAMKATDRESIPMLLRMLATPARLLRAGSVLSPDFMLRNLNRDQLTAFLFSENGYVPVLDTVRGALSLIKRDESFQNWLKSGGANATLVSLDRDYIQTRLFQLDAYKEAGLWDRAWNVAKSPVEFLRITSELIENSTRLGEFKKALGGSTDKADIQKAGFDSREVTLDFARIGAQTRAMNMITAFWNATIEGFDRTVRAAGNNPLAFTAKAVGAITLPSILLWWANKDDPRWDEIPRWQKDLFWIVMTEDHVFRIPKPFEVGVLFGTVPERLMDAYVRDNPAAFKEFSSTLARIFGINLVPTVTAPIIEQFANRSLFTGNPLVPFKQERLLGEYQYNDYTSELTKAMGQLVGRIPGVVKKSTDEDSIVLGGTARAITSPAILENYIRGWTGGLGMYAVQLADKALREAGALPDPVKPLATLADIPVVKAFAIRYPSATAQSVQDFYNDYFAKKKIYDTWTHAAEQGDIKAMERIQALDNTMFVQLDGIQDALSTQSLAVQLINKNPEMPAEEKRQLIDSIYFQMIELARAGNEVLETTKREFGR